ncbi:unnamed protein product [Staurois parvus]|uniref:Uncharacterized protein n=1 Tax=Staurois parvus TaxID=386267 RepID=A0ABN9F5H9_9NEOB|nr:unnamed protein product [Staurois parvus]
MGVCSIKDADGSRVHAQHRDLVPAVSSGHSETPIM